MASAYYLGSAESTTADFLLVWLKSSRSDPHRCVASQTCRPQVGSQLRPLCFYGRCLSRTVPAGCTGTTCQNFRGCPKFMRPRKFSPFPVKTQKFYLGSSVSYPCTKNSYMITVAVQIQLPYSQTPKWRPSSILSEVARIWL